MRRAAGRGTGLAAHGAAAAERMSAGSLKRLLAPRSIALIGGAWADAALAASGVIGYAGEVWRIHPTRPSSAALPFFGPNCYGFVNFFDGVALWPDQVVGRRRERGVALICQSGTIALNLLFNDRSLPIGYAITVGNQTRLAAEELIEHLCADERVTAIGLYLEGLRDAGRFAEAIARARAAGKPIAVVKTGRTAASTEAVRTHTGALAGADATFDAFCTQAGVARCESLATLCETLKIFHCGGPLPGRRVLLMGASGGDTAMAADAARHLGLEFPAMPGAAAATLRDILSERVHISNPFDFHTHVWFDYPRQRAMFSVALRAGYDAVGFLLDCPPENAADDSSYVRALDEFAAALPGAASRAVLISSLPESQSPTTRERCLAAGIVPLQGQREALEALDLAGAVGEVWKRGTTLELQRPRTTPAATHSLSEHDAKQALAAFGVQVPRARLVAAGEAAAAAAALGFPVVIKAAGAALEHKSEVGGVVLNVRTAAEAATAAQRLSALSDSLLVEEMVRDGVAEVLIGVTVDPQFGQLLVLGAGGVLTELLRDSVTLLPPFDAASIEAALGRLRVARLLSGFRGRAPGDLPALIQTVLACARYAQANLNTLAELDINPVIVRPAGLGAVAVDALIRILAE